MQGYFKKKHRTHLDLLSIPRLCMTFHLLSMQASTLLVKSHQYIRVAKYATTKHGQNFVQDLHRAGRYLIIIYPHPWFLSICPEMSSFLRDPTVCLVYKANRYRYNLLSSDLFSSTLPRLFVVLFFSDVFVPGLIWCNFLYLVTTAGFVADRLII